MKVASNATGAISLISMNLTSIPSPKTGYIAVDTSDNKLKFYNQATTSWENYNDVVTTAITALKDNVPINGDTLNKLNNKILGNTTDISNLTTNKINFTDIVDNLTSTDGTTKVLSANQGRLLKESMNVKTINNTLLSNTSNVTLTNITELSYSLEANKTYRFQYSILFRSTAAGTGLVLTISCPAGEVSANVIIPIANDGTASRFQGSVTSSGDLVVGTAVAAINTTYVATIEGVIVTTAGGILFPQFRSETNGTAVQVRIGSLGLLEKLN